MGDTTNLHPCGLVNHHVLLANCYDAVAPIWHLVDSWEALGDQEYTHVAAFIDRLLWLLHTAGGLLFGLQ